MAKINNADEAIELIAESIRSILDDDSADGKGGENDERNKDD